MKRALALLSLLMLSGCAVTAAGDLRDTFTNGRVNRAQVMTEEHYGDGTIRRATPRWTESKAEVVTPADK